MTRLLHDLGRSARTLARQGVVAGVVLSLALGITATLALSALAAAERSPSRA